MKHWYEHIIDFAKEKVRTVVWVFFGTSIILFTPSELLQHIHIDNLPELILLPIGLLFIGSFSLLIVDIGILLKNKIHRAHRKRLSKITIS